MSADDNKDNLEGINAPPEEEDTESHKTLLLRGVVCTNDDYGLSAFVPLLDLSPKAPAVFETVELQALVFFLSRLLVRAGGFTNVDPPH